VLIRLVKPSFRRRPEPSDFRHPKLKALGPGLRRDDVEASSQ